ncbi:helix-turn-helix domain-containing protein [uncultured Chryseobacterium sp.]|uniref:helix-turn-helix domain-containing protein n=1 Tax=uncultured Chryseobacterium sp. TaxID=259322 RepID=UPI0025D3365A|nr:helix-turn-helix domain-containing protein [uncultured Chryseobacterium sp.]
MDFKNIHIGKVISQRVKESEIKTVRICNFFKCTEEEIVMMYEAENLYPDIILKWCKLLKYDFFRLYSQHLMLYAPVSKEDSLNLRKKESSLPYFRKSIYSTEVIDFIIELIKTGAKTKKQVIEEYNIPKATLYKWTQKYDK